MTKVRINSERKICPWGGINFVIDEVERLGVPSLIDSHFGKRHGNSRYSYSDAILSLIYGTMCEVERLEDLTVIKERMHNGMRIPSPDAMAALFKEKFATKNEVVKSEDGMKHEININLSLNRLLLKAATHIKALVAGTDYVLDYDNTVIPCEKYDSEWSYKDCDGYQPGAFFIGETPVYIEGMNGNNPAAFHQDETMKRALSLLAEQGITVKTFRADCASYSKGVIQLCESGGIDFFIRAKNTKKLFEPITDQFNNWKKVTLKYDKFEITSFDYKPFGKCETYRVVTSRRPSKKGKLHKITGQPYVYRSVITRNRKISDLAVIDFYNQRGKMEHSFRDLGSDWNWNRLPFSFLNQNTAYMIISALGYTLYKHVVKAFSARVDFVESTWRLKAFRFNCIAVAAEWDKGTLVIYDQSRKWEQLGKAS